MSKKKDLTLAELIEIFPEDEKEIFARLFGAIAMAREENRALKIELNINGKRPLVANKTEFNI